jgi:cytidylate kinase
MKNNPDSVGKQLLITIDGPAGAGKTTVSRMLSDRLGYKYIDTGALYRGVAWEAKKAGISHGDDTGLEKLCGIMKLEFIRKNGELHLFSNGSDVNGDIRRPEISMLASAVSARPVVRKYLLSLQRELGKEKGAVFEGRDMGTVVFPAAEIKFFLNASVKTRALRRFKELSVRKDSPSLEDIERDIRIRDENDSTRKLAPLKPAEDAIEIDSTDIDAESVVSLMLSHVQKHNK